MLEVEGLTKSYDGLTACCDVSFVLGRGDILLVRGHNGSGKTTLVNLVSGVIQADAGFVRLGGTDVTGAGEVARARLGLGRSFQWPQVMPDWTVFECVDFAAALSRPAAPRPSWPQEVLVRCGLNSGGKLAADLDAAHHKLLDVAMTLARQPQVILLDEPCATLASHDISSVIEIIEWARNTWSAALLVVEHRKELLEWASAAPRCTTREMSLGRLLAPVDEAVAP